MSLGRNERDGRKVIKRHTPQEEKETGRWKELRKEERKEKVEGLEENEDHKPKKKENMVSICLG